MAWLAAAAFNIELNGDKTEASYAPPVATEVFDIRRLTARSWQEVPPRRVDLSGKSGEPSWPSGLARLPPSKTG